VPARGRPQLLLLRSGLLGRFLLRLLRCHLHGSLR
jgi:hypothetical protein